MSKEKRERSPTNNDKELLERIEKKKADEKAKLEAKLEALKIPLPKLTDEEASELFKEMEHRLIERCSAVDAGTDFWINPNEFTTSDIWNESSVQKWLTDYGKIMDTLMFYTEIGFARKWAQEQVEAYLADMVLRWNQLYSVFQMSYDPRRHTDYHYVYLKKTKETH